MYSIEIKPNEIIVMINVDTRGYDDVMKVNTVIVFEQLFNQMCF